MTAKIKYQHTCDAPGCTKKITTGWITEDEVYDLGENGWHTKYVDGWTKDLDYCPLHTKIFKMDME